MKIKNLELLMRELRTKLPEYLVLHKRDIKAQKFQCPNSPAHSNDDKTPSCGFYPDREHFHCFACGAAGDVFKAAAYIEGLPLSGGEFISDNVVHLAKLFSVVYEMVELTPEEEARVRVYKVLQLASNLMKNSLKKNTPETNHIKNYIEHRQWEKVAEEFGLGICPYDKLVSKLKARQVSDDTLVRAGLLPGTQQKRRTFHTALFEGRLVFPIRDHVGRVVSFASRCVTDGKMIPRYMNLYETELYKKGSILYNLDKARFHKKVFVVEGYADVITLVANGIPNVVALCCKTMTESQYKALVRCGVTEMVICLDNEKGAVASLEAGLAGPVLGRGDIEVKVKTLPEEKDPDDYVRKLGSKSFLDIEEVSVLDYWLRRLKKLPNDKFIRYQCFSSIVHEVSPITREQMLKKMAGELQVGFEAACEEFQLFQESGGESLGVLVTDMSKEQQCMDNALNAFEKWAWSRGELLGLNMGFPILTTKMEGLQTGIYLIGGRSNIGKSAFCLQLAQNIVVANSGKVFILYFSIDDSRPKVIARLLANFSGIPINDVSNPINKIVKSTALSKKHVVVLEQRRDAAINSLREFSAHLSVKDAGDGRSLKYIEKMIQVYKAICGDRQLVVIIDNLHKIASPHTKLTTRDRFTDISESLKQIVNLYDVPLVATTEIRKGQDLLSWPTEEDIKETIDLVYDADVIWMLHNEYSALQDNTKTKMFHVAGDGVVLPVLGVWARKNKTSDFKGRTYYKFYPSIARLDEVTETEREFYEKERRKK